MDQRTRRGVSKLLALALASSVALSAGGEEATRGEDEEVVEKVAVLEPLPVADRAEVLAPATDEATAEEEASGEEVAGVAAAEEPADDSWAAPAEPDETEAPERERAQALDVVWSWAEAWSEQDVDRYLALYSESFQVPDGLSRRQWEERRRQRLTAPDVIEVEISALGGPYEIEPGRVMVSFRQDYSSDSYSDVVLKTLELIREDGSWKIFAEIARPWR